MSGTSRRQAFQARTRARETIIATFQVTPAIEVVENLALSGLDALCLDGEHSAFDRGRMDTCLAMAKALDMPALARVSHADATAIMQVLDSGAVGIIVPHVDSPEKAAEVVKASRYGRGGRGFAGTTRSAGRATRTMAEVLDSSGEPVVFAQIEDVEGLEQVEAISATPGLDGLFVGPADLSVSLGERTMDSDALKAAMVRISAAAQTNGLALFVFVPNVQVAAEWHHIGFTGWFISSELGLMRGAATTAAEALRALD